jgi:hypothetical protein
MVPARGYWWSESVRLGACQEFFQIAWAVYSPVATIVRYDAAPRRPEVLMHPFAKMISIDGFKFQVESSVELSDDQARQCAFQFCRTNRLTDEHRNGLIRIVSKIDASSRDYF